MHSRAEAEPIVPEAFLAVIKTWRRSRRLVEPQALLFTTVRLRPANEFRRRDRKPASLVNSAESIDAASKAPMAERVRQLHDHQAGRREGAVGLPHRQRAVLALRFMHDLEVEVVAEMLGCKPDVLKYTQQKGLENMRKSRWLAGHAGTAEVHR